MSRWRGAALVAQRELVQRTRTRSFLWVSLILLVGTIVAVSLPGVVGDDGPTRYRVALAGGPAQADAALGAAARLRGDELELRAVAPPVAERLGREGDVDAGVVVGSDGALRIAVEEELSDDLHDLIVGGLADARLRDLLAQAGVSSQTAQAALSPLQVEVVQSASAEEIDDGNRGIGVVAAIVLVMALMLAGALIATGVAEEKASRISEVLLASLRPGQLLLGKVVGIGLVALFQVLLVAVPALIVSQAIGSVDLPSATGKVAAVAVLWFLLGFALYAAAFGALGALVSRPHEVSQSIQPLTYLLWGGYFISLFGAADPDSGWVRAMSLIPPFSPTVMPLRISTGVASTGDVALAAVLTAACAVALIALGGRIYKAGMVRTGGPRIKLGDALRSAFARG